MFIGLGVKSSKPVTPQSYAPLLFPGLVTWAAVPAGQDTIASLPGKSQLTQQISRRNIVRRACIFSG